MALFFMGCNSPTTTPSATSTPAVETSSVAKPVLTELTTAGDYDTLMNLEMVEYCLPYPKEYKEDYAAATGKGNHVFVSKDKKSKIIFSGMFADEDFEIIYHDVQADVQSITMKDPLHDVMEDTYFEIAWQVEKKMYWMKKWYREEEEETVTVQFEYPVDQSETMKSVIAAVTAASTRCE
jgi:hypothetical protein